MEYPHYLCQEERDFLFEYQGEVPQSLVAAALADEHLRAPPSNGSSGEFQRLADCARRHNAVMAGMTDEQRQELIATADRWAERYVQALEEGDGPGVTQIEGWAFGAQQTLSWLGEDALAERFDFDRRADTRARQRNKVS